MASTPSRPPSLITSSAPPGGCSSAGWNINLTEPGKLSLCRIRSLAAPNIIAMWASCPQECMKPGCCDIYSLLNCVGSSIISSPSISVRSAMHFPGPLPCIVAMTPVLAINFPSSPISSRSSITAFCVLNSWKLNSGILCNRRRISIIRSPIPSSSVKYIYFLFIHLIPFIHTILVRSSCPYLFIISRFIHLK